MSYCCIFLLLHEPVLTDYLCHRGAATEAVNWQIIISWSSDRERVGEQLIIDTEQS